MVEEVRLPTYETLLTEAIRSLAVDSGLVSSPVAIANNTLTDSTKDWASGVHKNRLVKIVRGTGAGQIAVISDNSRNTLIIRGGWLKGIAAGAVYVILEKDLAQILRDVLGGGSDISIPTEFDELKEALRTLAEASVDTGVADDTSTVNYLDDSSKTWPPSPGGFENLIVEITEGTGEGQFAKIASNTATRITFVVAMPVAPDSTSKYRIGFFGKMASDITAWGGTALTGRDISLDLAKLDVALSTIAAEATLAKLIPIAKAAIFNTALPAAEANWLGSDIEPTNSPSYLRIYACVSVTGILRVARTIGGVTVTEDLNSATALVAGAAYLFTVPWRTGDSINIRYSVTTGTINRLLVDEIGGAE